MADTAIPATVAAEAPARRWRMPALTMAGKVGLAIVLFWIVVAILAPYLAPHPPNRPVTAPFTKPNAVFWLGADHLGRDMLSRIIWGARRVLAIVPIAVLGAAALGIVLGLYAGYRRGLVDAVISRVCDIVLSFPMIILYLIVIARFGASVTAILLVIWVTKAPIIYRLARAKTIELREREYVAAAAMRGESTAYILFAEILPNARGPIIVDFCLRLGYTTILIGVLGFLGIGLPPPDPDWGGMARETYGMMMIFPHMSIIPCLAISSLVVGFNLLAIGLEEDDTRG